MKNQVIEVLNLEHGKKVIEYWKSMGIDVIPYGGGNTLDGENAFRYYGVIDGLFSNYTINAVRSSKAEIIELPEEKTFPRRMLVSDDADSLYIERLVLCKLPEKAKTSYIAVQKRSESDFSEGEEYVWSSWKYAKELPEVEEMTLEQVCKELGREIKIVE